MDRAVFIHIVQVNVEKLLQSTTIVGTYVARVVRFRQYFVRELRETTNFKNSY